MGKNFTVQFSRFRGSLLIIYAVIVFLSLPSGLIAQDDQISISLWEKVCREIQDKYLDSVSEEQLVKWGIDGMLTRLDPYNDFYTRDRIDQLQSITTGEYEGIGTYLDRHDGKIIVTSPIENSPASRAGILPGDVILKIDDKNVTGLTVEESSALVKGPRGSTVTLTIERAGESNPLIFKITREKIVIQDIPYWGTLTEGLGYVRLMHFSQKAPEEMERVLKELKKKKITGLIMDLRGNPGGLLSAAVGVADLFVKKGEIIVSTRSHKTEYTNEHRARRDPVFPYLSLVVLVDHASASASEIVAGAIQDLDIGLILGHRTYGKGLVQTVLYPSITTAIKLTTAKYYTPSGRSIQGLIYHHDGFELTSVPADSTKEIFHTVGGRLVYGGGGIQPDIESPDSRWSALVLNLKKQSMFLQFAVSYVASHPDLTPVVRVNDNINTAFYEFLKEKHYSSQIEGAEKLSELIQIADSLALGEEPKKLLVEAQKYFMNQTIDRINLRDPGITYFLEQEINWVLDGERGKSSATIANDREIQEAIALITSPQKYQQYLRGQIVTKLPGLKNQ